MENMQYAEELLREFLVFRGFTSTLQAFESELSTDIGKGFQVDRILELIFSVYVPKFQAEKLVGLLNFCKQCISSTEMVLIATLTKLEVSILRYYIVHAIQFERKDKLTEFFGTYGNDLLQSGQDWMPWFGIPTLLKISTEKNTVKRLKKDIRQLNDKLSQLQALLEDKEAQLCLLRSMASSATERGVIQKNLALHPISETLVKGAYEEVKVPSGGLDECKDNFTTDHQGETEVGVQDWDATSPSTLSSGLALSKQEHCSSSTKLPVRDGGAKEDLLIFQENGGEVQIEEFPEVKIEFQETFLGHTSPISRCRFSATGNNIASASLDGTVRIWTYDSSTSTSRNATIYCGAEIMSLDWECKSDRLLLIGTADGGIKAWNVDAKRVVCDLNTSERYPRVLDMKCSPVESIFVSAAASRGHGTSFIDQMGFASLTVWNMKTWKATTVLPLGDDPPAITSVCFNHNGKILAASATDGMIHMFDMSAGLQITGWPAHDSAVSSVLFGPDETSIFSLGSDGKIFEWSLHNQGRVLWSKDCNRFFNHESADFCRHEMALDATGRRLMVTSNSVRSPIYQVQGHLSSGLRTLPHTQAITTVDWHPTLPIYLTGSADHSVRVTSIY